MSNDDDDGPDDEESILIGICGIFIFFFLLGLSILAFVSSLKHKYSKLIFGFAALMCIFELPRSIAMVIQGNYHDQSTYVLHMIANFFFFISFTFVCLLLREAIDLSKSSSPLRNKIVFKGSTIESLFFTKYSLYLTNVVFGIIMIVTSVYCMLSSSLFSYFHHDVSYKVYTYFDMAKNLVYSNALLYYGCKLRSRIQGFSKQMTVHQDSSGQETLILNRLEFAVWKLIIVMSVCIVSFVLRATMLLLKAYIVEEHQSNPSGLPAYGMLWFWLSNYIPYMCPILAFVYFLGNVTPSKTFHWKFRLFSKESNVDPNLQESLRDHGGLSASIASTLYEEEFSMNQVAPSLKEFLYDSASKENRHSLDSAEDGQSLFYGMKANNDVTAGGDTKISLADTDGGVRASRNIKYSDNIIPETPTLTSNSQRKSGLSLFQKSKSGPPSITSSNPLQLPENQSSVHEDEERGNDFHELPLTESQSEKQRQLSDPDGISSFWG